MYSFLSPIIEEPNKSKILGSKQWLDECHWKYLESILISNGLDLYICSPTEIHVNHVPVYGSRYTFFFKESVVIVFSTVNSNEIATKREYRYDITEEELFQMNCVNNIGDLSMADIELFNKIKNLYIGV